MFKEWLTRVQKTARASKTRGIRNLQSVQTGVRNNFQTYHIHSQRRTMMRAAEDSSAEPRGSITRNVGAMDSDAALPALEGIIPMHANAELEVSHQPHKKVDEQGEFRKTLRPLVDNLYTSYLHKVYAAA